MARRASVRYWASEGTWTDENGQVRHGAYCCRLNGTKHVLGVGPDDYPNGSNYNKAVKAFGCLAALGSAATAEDGNTCRVVLELYMRTCEKKDSPNTLEGKKRVFAAFAESEMFDLHVYQVTPFLIEQWLSDRQQTPRPAKDSPNGRLANRWHQWGDAATALAVNKLHAAFRWAIDRRLIKTNPFQGIKAPSTRARSREAVLAPGDHERIVQCILGRKRNQKLAEFATCLHATGARPGELLMATATDWNDRLGALVYYADDRRLEGEARHKTAGKGKDRRIFFTGEALTIMRALVKKHPKGPLWRTRRGTPWNRTNMNASFQVVGERLGIEGLTPYSYRHTYATRWLEKGGSIDDLAALLGNTPAMIRKHYSHICDNVDRLRDLAEKFTATPTPEGRSETPSPAVLPFASGKEAV